jgi:hypothetical protein
LRLQGRTRLRLNRVVTGDEVNEREYNGAFAGMVAGLEIRHWLLGSGLAEVELS